MINNKDEKFEHAIKFTLSHEGGYVNDPDDEGGETNFGIAKHSYPLVDIKALTVEEAKDIYKRDFWSNQLYKLIDDTNISTKIFDLAVNMGPKRSHRIVQSSLRAMGHNIPIDGVLGPLTLLTINNANPEELLTVIKSQTVKYYKKIVISHPAMIKFINGWLKRANA